MNVNRLMIRNIINFYQKPIRICWLISWVKFVVMSTALIYIDRFNSDMVENIYWGQEWQAGYYKHPPMFAWVSEIWVQFFNNEMYFYHILTAIVFSFCSILNFLLFRKILTEKKAVLSVILLEGVVYSNFVNVCVNANTLLFVINPLVCLFGYKVAEKNNHHVSDWILFGLFSGIAVLTKYSAGLIVVSCGIYILYVKKWKVFHERGFYIGAFLCILMFAPHAIWVYNNDFLTLTYVSDQQTRNFGFFESRIIYTLELLGHVLLNIIPFIIAFLFILKRPIFNNVKISDNNSVFLLLISIIPFFLMTLIGGVWVKGPWLIAHVFLMPVMFLWFFNVDISKKRLIRCVSSILIFYFGVSTFLIAVYGSHPKFSETIFEVPVKSQRAAYTNLAKYVNNKYFQLYNKKPKYICSKDFVAGGIAMYSRGFNSLHVIPQCNLYVSKWVDLKDLISEGIVVVSNHAISLQEKIDPQTVATNDKYMAYEMFDKEDFTGTFFPSEDNSTPIFVQFYRNLN